MYLLDIKNKNIIVTGASGGIGGHIAKALYRNGANLIVVARNKEKLDQLKNELNATDERFLSITADIANQNEIEKVIHLAFEKYLTIDGLVNVAGIGNADAMTELNEVDWDKVMDINVKGIWLFSKFLTNQLKKSKHHACSIINISSALARRTNKGRLAYATSKAAVEHMTKQMALELADYNIRVNAVAPGYFRTSLNAQFLDSEKGLKTIEKIPLKRTGQLSEFDGLIILLLSNASSYMTGSVIDIDGGLSVNRM